MDSLKDCGVIVINDRETTLTIVYRTTPEYSLKHQLLETLTSQHTSTIDDFLTVEEVIIRGQEITKENVPLFKNWVGYEVMGLYPQDEISELFPDEMIQEMNGLMKRWDNILERNQNNHLRIVEDEETYNVYNDKMNLELRMIKYLEG